MSEHTELLCFLLALLSYSIPLRWTSRAIQKRNPRAFEENHPRQSVSPGLLWRKRIFFGAAICFLIFGLFCLRQPAYLDGLAASARGVDLDEAVRNLEKTNWKPLAFGSFGMMVVCFFLSFRSQDIGT